MGACDHEHGHDHAHSHDHASKGDHDHDHDHEHDHDHSHDHKAIAARAGGRRRLAIALGVTVAFMIAEAVGGLLSNSRALLADAAHMLSDAGALALSLMACHFATRPATSSKSYGWLRLEILAALANGASLVLVGGLILWESVERIIRPEPIEVGLMLVVAAFGLGANLVAAYVLHGDAHGHEGGEGHLNVSAAYAHVLGDLLGSVGAIVAGVLMWRTGWWIADPIVAALVGLLVLKSAWSVTKRSADILLEAVPAHIDLDHLSQSLSSVEGITSVHDVHVWTMSSGVHLMTCHAVVGDHGDHHEVLERLSCVVRERFGIHHSTIQLECHDLSAKESGAAICNRAG